MKTVLEYCKNINLSETCSLIKKYFYFKENFSIVENPTYLKNKREYITNIDNLKRIKFFVEDKKCFRLLTVENLHDIFNLIEKNISLDIEDFIKLIPFLESTENVVNDFKKVNFLKDNDIDEAIQDLRSFIQFLNKYQKTFTEDLQVNSDATPTLYSIRKEISFKKSSIDKVYTSLKNKYKDYLSNEESFKDGYQTLSVKSNFLNKIDGIVLKRSNTKQTLYIVPKEIILIENELNDLYDREKQEIAKILTDYTNELHAFHKPLLKNYQILLLLDKCNALVQFSLDYDFTIPNYSKEELVLKSITHPLIPSNIIVKNDFELSKKIKTTFILSGPNAGGKSVLFKEIGLCCVLAKLGFPINCSKESFVPFFNNIFLVLSDDESIADNLSKFTSHLKKLNNILNKVDDNSIIIVDEICSGTSPRHGEAIAISFLNEYMKTNSFVLLSTHYDAIKRYGNENEHILNGSMEFDTKNLTPTYRLILNQSGSSFALEACYKVNVDENVIKNARKYLIANQSNEEHLEYLLSKQLNKYTKLNNELEEKISKYDDLLNKKNKELENLNQQKEKFNLEYQTKLEKLLSDKKDELEKTFRLGKEKLDFKTYSDVKGKLNKFSNKDIKETFKPEEKIKEPTHSFKINEYVFYNNMSKCKIISIKNKKVILSINGYSIKTTIDKIKYDATNSNKTEKVVDSYPTVDREIIKKKSFKNELNIIGQTSDEAMSNVEMFISDCLLRNIKVCRIIHGMGNFILRNTLIKLLKKLPEVESYRDGNEYEGGMGATVIYLK